jgi:hypothetical protein
MGGMSIGSPVLNSDQKTIYVISLESLESTVDVRKWRVDSSSTEKFLDKCCLVFDADPHGKYLLGSVFVGKRVASTKCRSLRGNASRCFLA